jgi:hypothetical protein
MIVTIILIFGLAQFIYDKIIKIFDKYRTNKITLNFEDDILFLDYIISFYLKKEVYDFDTMQKSPTGKIVNLQYKTLLAKIVEDVTNSLSEEYILKLRNYFDTEALTVFIMHHVDMELTKIILEKNIIQE